MKPNGDMLAMEAREWVARVRKEVHTRPSGKARLRGIVDDVAKRRGKPSAEALRLAIEAELGYSIKG